MRYIDDLGRGDCNGKIRDLTQRVDSFEAYGANALALIAAGAPFSEQEVAALRLLISLIPTPLPSEFILTYSDGTPLTYSDGVYLEYSA